MGPEFIDWIWNPFEDDETSAYGFNEPTGYEPSDEEEEDLKDVDTES